MTVAECTNPNAIEEGDLAAYLHGEALPHVGEHIARCPYCAEQVERLRWVDAQLLAAFYRDACPTPETLADYLFDRLSGAEKLRVAAHVRGCPACSAELVSVRGLTEPAPPSLLERLREALVARPITLNAAGVRGGGWQGRFEVGRMVITVSSQTGQLSGRVRERNAPPAADYRGQAWLLSPDSETTPIPQSPVDAHGRFHFSGLPPGSYALLLQIGARNVALESIQIE